MIPGRAVRRLALALLACVTLIVAGCGSSTLSSGQLRRKAGRICTTAQQHTESIPAPVDPDSGARFLKQGIDALAPQVASLHRLKPPDELAEDYAAALRATDRELTVLRSTLQGLRAGNDPVVALKTLQHDLNPAEDAAAGAWRTAGIADCTKVMG
jgi:hypothetical protein